jgi:hypothetical protein
LNFFLSSSIISLCNQVVPEEKRLLLNHIVIQVCIFIFTIYYFIYLFVLGVFIARSKDDDMLLTRNMVVGESVYGEKRISVDV